MVGFQVTVTIPAQKGEASMRVTKPLRISICFLFFPVFPFMVVCFFYIFSDAHALPQFTRQYDLKCSKCHLAPPTVNYIGRRFLLNGYRFFREERDNQTAKDLIKFDRTVPLGVWLSTQPYENENGDDRIRPFHEARLYVGGGIYRDVSAFIRLDLEQDKGYRLAHGSQRSVTIRRNS